MASLLLLHTGLGPDIVFALRKGLNLTEIIPYSVQVSGRAPKLRDPVPLYLTTHLVPSLKARTC